MKAVRMPSGFGTAGKRLWRACVDEYDLLPHQIELLRVACEAADRCAEAAKLVRRDGVTIADRFGQQKAHPAVMVERDARLAMAKMLRELHLEVDELVDVDRPPRLRSVR